jgi:hypothetical protein
VRSEIAASFDQSLIVSNGRTTMIATRNPTSTKMTTAVVIPSAK